MATDGMSPSGTAREARASLDQARRTEDAVREVDAPWWYFGVSAALFAALVLAQLSGRHATAYMIGVLVAIAALNLAAAWRAGVLGMATRNRGFVVTLVLVSVAFVASLGVYDATGESWTVALFAAAAAALTLIGGWLYRRDPS